MKIDVLLIQPYQGEEIKFNGIMENIGLGLISSYLKKHNFNTYILYETFHETNFYAQLDYYIAQKPEVIGIALITYYYHPSILKLTSYLTKNGYDGYLIVGGHSASFLAETILRIDKNIDGVIIGLGEEPFRKLLGNIKYYKKAKGKVFQKTPSCIYKSNGEICHTGILKKTPQNISLMPDRDFLKDISPKKEKQILFSVSFSRGCFGKCLFCSINKFFNSYSDRIWFSRSVEEIITEIKALISMGKKEIFFVDDEFFGNDYNKTARTEMFCNELKKLKEKIAFSICSRVDSINKEQLILLKSVGLEHIFLGIEFLTQEELNFYKKGITVKDIHKSVNIIKSLGISLQCGFIMFHPFTRLDLIKKNLYSLKALGEAKPLNIMTKLVPYWGTEIFKILAQENMLIFDSTKPSIVFKEHNVQLMYELGEKALLEYMKIIKYFWFLVEPLTLEWQRGHHRNIMEKYSEDIDNIITNANTIFFNFFSSALNYLIKKGADNKMVKQEWILFSEQSLHDLSKEYEKLTLRLLLLIKIKERLIYDSKTVAN